MINSAKKKKLMEAWGAPAENMECLAQVRVYDALSPWQCYILAMNPADGDEISCIISALQVEVCMWSLAELGKLYNSDGEPVLIDKEYRPRKASEIYKKLQKDLYEAT